MISPTPPAVSLNGRYTATQSARALGVHRNTFRMWVNAGYIAPIICRAKSNRVTTRAMFSGAAIRKFWEAQQ